MSRVREYFLREGSECLAAARSALDGDPVDLAALHRAVRRFRGSAQMARFGDLADRAREMEDRLRPDGERGSMEGAGDAALGSGEEVGAALHRDVRAALASLDRDLEAVREGRLEEDPRMETGMEEQGGEWGEEWDEGQGQGQGQGEERGEQREVVPVETLEYRGEGALMRALDLRDALEDAVASGDAPSSVLDELFDLIRLGAK